MTLKNTAAGAAFVAALALSGHAFAQCAALAQTPTPPVTGAGVDEPAMTKGGESKTTTTTTETTQTTTRGAAQSAALPQTSPGPVKQIVATFPETARRAADAMIAKYGQPDEATPTMLMWHDTGPFLHTIVYKEEVAHDFPMPHKDVLEQVIHYDVPADKFDELAAYDGSVIAERTKGELSARCDKEEANFLALNLADQVIKGQKTADQARQAYADAIEQFVAGQKPSLMTSLQFQVAATDITNEDEAVIDVAAQ